MTTGTITLMHPYTVYMCDALTRRAPVPRNEVEVMQCQTFEEAADVANDLKRRNPSKSFTVGGGPVSHSY